MLRIHIGEDTGSMSFSLEGKLAGPWVAELYKCWQMTLISGPGRPISVNLTGVTFVDDHGTELLTRMRRQGVKLLPGGCLTKAIVERIEAEISKGEAV